MRSPFAPLPLLIFMGLLGFLMLMIQFELVRIAFERLGLSSGSAFLLLMGSLLGGAINIPLFKTTAEPPSSDLPLQRWRRLLGRQIQPFTGYTLVALNVGGCLIPVAFSLFLLVSTDLPLQDAILAVMIIATLSYLFSRPVSGIGIVMPVLLAPFAAALVSLVLNPANSAPLAYIGGTLGVLIGADLMRLGHIGRLGAPVASIGGAGTFDGIFLTGVVAVLLA